MLEVDADKNRRICTVPTAQGKGYKEKRKNKAEINNPVRNLSSE